MLCMAALPVSAWPRYPGAVLVFGVFAGSLLWWLLLASGVGLMRGRLSLGILRWISHASGLLIGGFGAWALLAALLAMLQV